MGELDHFFRCQTFWRWLLIRVQGILRAAGVQGGVAAAGVVETGDLLELWKSFAESVGLG